MGQPYDNKELNKLIKGCTKRSEVYKKIDEAIADKNNPLFAKSPRNIKRVLQRNGLLDDLIADTKGASAGWSEKKKKRFKKDYASAQSVTDVTGKYKLDSDQQTRNVAKGLGATRDFKAKRKSVKERNSSQKASAQIVNKRLLELIETGTLVEDDGFNKLHTAITKEFPQNRPDKRKFKNKIYHLIFERVSQKQSDHNKNLQDIVRMNLSDEETIASFERIYPFIPTDFIEKRMRWHQGLNTGRGKKLMGANLHGLGRIDLGEVTPGFKIPRTSFKNPFPIKTKDANKWSVMVLNGTNLGLKHAPDIVGNVARKALSDAEGRKDKAIILTNFLCFDLKKAGGPAKTARAQILGDNINPELIKDKHYKQIVEYIIKNHPVDQIAYRTTEELLNDVLGGWIKVCTKPNNHPEYNGNIYISIGVNELALICSLTYWEIRWWTLKKQKELDDKISIIKKQIQREKKALQKASSNGNTRRARILYNNIATLNEELDSLLYQRSITIVSNVANQESQRFFRYAYGKVIQKIESAIPNSKVIGEGTNYLNIGGQIVKIYIPSHLRVSDGLLSNYCLAYGPDVLRENNPKAVVICHPWALQFRETGREADHDGQRDSMQVCVAPIAIDDEYLRSELTSLRKKDHPIMKAVYNQTFKAGVLRLRCSNGTINTENIPIKALESFKDYPRSGVTKKTTGSAVYNRGTKYIWMLGCSDQHWGGRAKEFVWDKNKNVRLSMAEAVFEMMRREGLFDANDMPVHFLISTDDGVQAQNVKYRTEPHPHQIPPHVIEKITGDFLIEAEKKGTKEAALEAAEKIRRISLIQFEKRGDDYLLTQIMQMMERHIEPNIDAFSAILRRAESANIKVQGVGEIVNAEYGGHDSRNVGLITLPNGNHFARTTDMEMIEGPLYSQKLRDMLCAKGEWKDKQDYVRKMVLSPIYGKTCIGWGVISVDGKHQYGLEVRSAPNAMAGWGDTLKGHVKRDLQRGNYSRIWNKKLPIIKWFGDKHFLGLVITGYAIYKMSPAAVHTDAYGENGFPPNNTGISFLGIPADGPDTGPVLCRYLPFDVIKSFLENPRPFDWVEYLPNPA